MIISAVAFAQEKEKPIIKESSEKHPFPEVTSTSIGGANYELISPHDSAVSYRLNKETGEVWYKTDKLFSKKDSFVLLTHL